MKSIKATGEPTRLRRINLRYACLVAASLAMLTTTMGAALLHAALGIRALA
jgi:hypothetical protein